MRSKISTLLQTDSFTNLAIALSFCSMSYEFLLAKGISFLSGMPIVWQPISIGVFLIGMGLGSFLYARSEAYYIARFSRIEFALAFVGGCSAIALYWWHIIYRIYLFDATHAIAQIEVSFVYYFAIFSQVFVISIGILTGFELPILMRLATQDGRRSIKHVLFWYQIGILAAVIYLYLITRFRIDVLTAVVPVAAINLFAAIYLSFRQQARQWMWSSFWSLAVACVLIFNWWYSPNLLRLQTKNFYYNVHRFYKIDQGEFLRTKPFNLFQLGEMDQKYPDVERITTQMQTIDLITRYEANDAAEVVATPDKVLHLDQHFQFSFGSELDYHEHMAFIPMHIYNKEPKNVLVLGAGDGLLVRELLQHVQDVSIDLVEIDAEMLAFAKEHPDMRDLNRDSLSDPRVRLYAMDAFIFLRAHAVKKYDAVYIDFPYPFTFDAAKLYSAEFLRLVLKVTKPDAFVVMDAPYDLRAGEKNNLNNMIGATVQAAGFGSMVAFEGKYESFVSCSLQPDIVDLGFYAELRHSYQTIQSDYFMRPGKVKIIEFNALIADEHSMFKPVHMFYPDPRF